MAVDKPTERAQEAIAGSAQIAAERGNPVVEPDHLLLPPFLKHIFEPTKPY
mgnify:CR=1 FL=1